MVTFENATGKYSKITHGNDEFLFEKDQMENLRKITPHDIKKQKRFKVYRGSNAFFMVFDSFLTDEMDEAPFNPVFSKPCVFEITGAKEIFVLSNFSESTFISYYNSYEYHYLFCALGQEDELYFYHIEPTMQKCVFAGMVSKDCYNDISELSIKKTQQYWIVTSFKHPTLSPRFFFQRINYDDDNKNQLITIATKDILFETDSTLFLRNGFLDKATCTFKKDDGSYEESLVWDKAFYVIPFLRGQSHGSENYWIAYRNSNHPFEFENSLNNSFIKETFHTYQSNILNAFVWSKKDETELYPIQQIEEDTWLLCYDTLLPHIVKCPRSALCNNDIYQQVLKESTCEYFYFIYYHPTDDSEELAYFVSDKCPIVLAPDYLYKIYQNPQDTAMLIQKAFQFEGKDVIYWDDVIITLDANHTLKNRIVSYRFKSICNLEGTPKEKNVLPLGEFVQYAAFILISENQKLCIFFNHHISQEFDTCTCTEFPGLFKVSLNSLPNANLYYYIHTNELLSEEQFKSRFAANISDF